MQQSEKEKDRPYYLKRQQMSKMRNCLTMSLNHFPEIKLKREVIYQFQKKPNTYVFLCKNWTSC